MNEVRAILVLLTAFLFVPLPGQCEGSPYPEKFQQRSEGFLVLGDTQRTLWSERLFLRREQNDIERERIVHDISTQQTDLLVMVGDLVCDGSSSAEWNRFDHLFEPILRAGIPILPALGNHDYWGSNSRALALIGERFPQLAQSHWYERVYGNLGLIWLDSNHDELTEGQWAAQASWYRDALQKFEADDKIRGVLVFTHQPPFTNSTVTEDDHAVQSAFVGPFLSTKKSLAFISGHTHAYERFQSGGKTFIVTGGGGGPRVKLLEGKRRHHVDLYTGPSPRPFHYLKIVPGPDGIQITVRGLDKGAKEFRLLESFELPFSRP